MYSPVGMLSVPFHLWQTNEPERSLLPGTGETYTNLAVKCQRYTNYLYVSISTKVVLAILSRVKMLLPISRLGNIYEHCIRFEVGLESRVGSTTSIHYLVPTTHYALLVVLVLVTTLVVLISTSRALPGTGISKCTTNYY